MSDERFPTVLLFGAPGVGKGTQGAIFGCIPGFFHLSSGAVFRALDPHSPAGREVTADTVQGRLVPDELTMRVVFEALDRFVAQKSYHPHSDLLLLDGIPRTVPQARMLADRTDVLRVIYLVADDENAIVERIRQRAVLENRPDDTDESIIRERFAVYRRETAPVLDCYPDSIIDRVDAMGTPAEVLRSVLDRLIPVRRAAFAARTG